VNSRAARARLPPGAAVLPLTLADAIGRLPNLVRRLRRTEPCERRTQRERFRRKPFIPWPDAVPSCILKTPSVGPERSTLKRWTIGLLIPLDATLLLARPEFGSTPAATDADGIGDGVWLAEAGGSALRVSAPP